VQPEPASFNSGLAKPAVASSPGTLLSCHTYQALFIVKEDLPVVVVLAGKELAGKAM